MYDRVRAAFAEILDLETLTPKPDSPCRVVKVVTSIFYKLAKLEDSEIAQFGLENYKSGDPICFVDEKNQNDEGEKIAYLVSFTWDGNDLLLHGKYCYLLKVDPGRKMCLRV